jgi:hypothetical protein
MATSDFPRSSGEKLAVHDAPRVGGRTKRPYVAPTVKSSDMGYVLAGCGKITPTQHQCSVTPHTS